MQPYKAFVFSTAVVCAANAAGAEDVSYRQLGQLMTVTGGNDQGTFAFGPEWSEELGLSVTGRAGFMLGQGAAVGVIGEFGENVTEGMINLGFNLSDDMAMILTAGQLSERILVGDTGEREWVAQDEFGLAINGENLSFNAYYVDAASTDNFIGAITYGAEIEGSTDVADNAILSASLGYQRMEWDGDAFEALEEMTGSVDLAVAVTDTFRFSTFADYNVSEAQAGIGASWNLGVGMLHLDYTYVQTDDLSGLSDDHRVGLTFSMPLGGGVGAVASRDRAMPGMVTASTQGASRGRGILAQVMRRPEYLPERPIVTLESDGALACVEISDIIRNVSTTGLFSIVYFQENLPNPGAITSSGSGSFSFENVSTFYVNGSEAIAPGTWSPNSIVLPPAAPGDTFQIIYTSGECRSGTLPQESTN